MLSAANSKTHETLEQQCYQLYVQKPMKHYGRTSMLSAASTKIHEALEHQCYQLQVQNPMKH